MYQCGSDEGGQLHLIFHIRPHDVKNAITVSLRPVCFIFIAWHAFMATGIRQTMVQYAGPQLTVIMLTGRET